jgi:hypothetical protein
VSKTSSGRLFEVDKVNDGPDDIRFGFRLESVVIAPRRGDRQGDHRAHRRAEETGAAAPRIDRPLTGSKSRRFEP